MNSAIKIMLVEDDEILAKEIVLFLQKWGYETSAVTEFNDILAAFRASCPQLILMDINLPYYDGFYWCNKIRELSEAPVIFISSRNGDVDKIMALAQGGDDYVEKPFRLEVLRAKIEAMLRRTYQYKVKDRIYIGNDLYFEQNTSTLVFEQKTVELTKSEKRIMEKLLENRPDIVTRDELMMTLWSTDEFVSDTALTTMVSRLRTKLSDVCHDEIIRTKKGEGYYIS
ncbi:MAG: response regulator transcription factor [Clostridium sp.]|nr:response regulator transcription factor [Clostridium sp.]